MRKSRQSPVRWRLVAMVGAFAGMPLVSAVGGPAASDPVVRLDAVVEGPVSDVWAVLTTGEGIESWMVPMADVDLRIGGKMRTNYNPRGTFGDPTTAEYTILSFEPERMISVKTTKPADGFPLMEAFKSTWTVIYVEPLASSRTRIGISSLGYADEKRPRLRMSVVGWQKGEEWDQAFDYFLQANAAFLNMLHKGLAGKP